MMTTPTFKDLEVLFAADGRVLVRVGFWAHEFARNELAVACVANIMNRAAGAFEVNHKVTNEEFARGQFVRTLNFTELWDIVMRRSAHGTDVDDLSTVPFLPAFFRALRTLVAPGLDAPRPPFVAFPDHLSKAEIAGVLEALTHEVSRLINRAFINLPEPGRISLGPTDADAEAVLRMVNRQTTECLAKVDAYRILSNRLRSAVTLS